MTTEKGHAPDWRSEWDKREAEAEQGEEFQRKRAMLAPLGNNGDPAPMLPLADLDAWATSQPTPKAFILAGRIPKREITLLTGDGGTNKSTFGQQLATCCAAGVPLLGVELEQCVTLYVTAEDDFDRLEWMHQHICDGIGISRTGLTGRLHLASVRGTLNNELATFDAENRIVSTPAFTKIKATLIEHDVDLLILDNVAHMFAGNENDRGQVTAFVNMLYSLCRMLSVTVVLVAHRNKAGDSYSGSTAWLNAVRSQLLLERPEDSHDPDERVLTVGKANYARTDETLRFRWHEFALIRDEDLPADTRAELSKVIQANGENAAFLACLRQRASQGDARAVGASPGPNYAPAQFEGMPDAKGFKKPSLKRAMDRLFALGIIETVAFENRAKGRTINVLREVLQGSPNAFPNPSRTAIPNDPEPQPELPRTHTTSTTYYPGAALGPAAPGDRDDLDWSDGVDRDLAD